MPEFLREYWLSIPPAWRLGLTVLYLTIGFFAGAWLHGRFWQFAKEHPITRDDSYVTIVLKTSFARWVALMMGFFLWWLVPFMYAGGWLLSQFLIRRSRS